MSTSNSTLARTRQIGATLFALAVSVVLVTAASTLTPIGAPVAGAQPGSGEGAVVVAVTCLASNGRVDVNVVNTGADPAVYRIELGALSPREVTVPGGDWGRLPFTGRRDGVLDLSVRRDGMVVRSSPVTVACDTSPPQVTTPTVQVVNSCRDGNGYILFQLANSTSESLGWVIDFEGVPRRSTTTAPYGASVRAVTGRPDGTYQAVLRSGSARIERTVSVQCDGVAPAPTPTPTAVPTPTPTPDGNLTPGENLALIAANPTRNGAFDNNAFRDIPMSQIQVGDLTVPEDLYNEGLLDTSTSGYFRVKCEISHFAYDDPIVFPNQPGRAHLHMFFGNTAANAYSTFDSLLNTGTGTCNGEDLNRTAYWIPALLDSDGNALIPFEVMVYYKNDNFRLNGANELVEPFPDDLRLVVGNAMADAPQTTLSGGTGSLPVVSFNCGRPYSSSNELQPLLPDCYAPAGGNPWSHDALEIKIAFPQCHNPDDGTYVPGGAHMSYSEGGYYGAGCPDSHPYDVSSIMYRIFYSPASYGGALDDVYLSSDVRPDGTILPAGTTLHADWFGAWHGEAMDMWVENCNNTQADCEVGILDRDPMTSLVRRQENTYPRGYLARAEDLIQLCPGKQLDSARPLESVANCRTGG